MQAAVFTGPKQIEIREFDLPALKPEQVLVKVKAVGLCTWEQPFPQVQQGFELAITPETYRVVMTF